MRILAVRGENLASLAAPFEISLAAEPLAGAGLFAITGETGAGKSTLLDAICLALYGTYPRVRGDGPDEDLPDVLGDVVRAKDPRSILRRGAASGRCEVDFLGIDGALYRATWSINRARGKAGGRLQKVMRHLERIDASGAPVETVADQILSVDAAVVRLTDLTFEQFRRTVLLAQGDFDAFLRADDRERADLLEKITGTEIYATLSRRVYDRTKEVARQLDLLAARRAEIGLMEPAEREARLAQRSAVEARLGEIAAGAEAARATLARLDTLAEARARLTAAEEERARAADEDAAAEPDRLHLAAIRRAQGLRPALDRFEEGRRRYEEARRRLIEVDERLAAATPRLAAARETRDKAGAALREITAEIARLTPQWEAAARLDGEIEQAASETERARVRAEQDEAALAMARGRLLGLERRRDTAAADFVRLETELDAAPDLARLALGWDEIEGRLGERSARLAERREAEARAEGAATTLAAIGARLAALDLSEESEAAARTASEARLAERGEALAAIDEAGLGARDAVLARLIEGTARTLPAIEDAARNTEAHRDAIAAGEAAERAGTSARAARDTATGALAEARAQRTARAAAVALADAVASTDAGRLREHLVADEACPVCGSTDHPVTRDPTVHAALMRVREERETLDRTIGALESTLAGLEATIAGAHAERRAADARIAEAEESALRSTPRIADAVARIAALAGTIELAFEADADDLAPVLRALDALVTAERETIAVALERARALRGGIEGLRGEIARRDAARETRRRQRDEDRAALGEARVTAASAEEAVRQARSRITDIDERTAPRLAPFGVTPTDLDRDGDMVARRLSKAVADHRAKEKERLARVTEIAEIEREREGAATDVDHAEKTALVSGGALGERSTRLRTLREARAALLGGQATAAHREAQAARSRTAEDALTRAEAELALVRSEHETALAQREERHRAVTAASADLIDCEVARTHALAAADLDPDAARILLALPDEAIADVADRLAIVDERLRAAQTTVEARAADLAECGTADDDDAETAARANAEAILTASLEETAAGNRELGALSEALVADDRARAAASDVEAEITAAREARAVWGALDEAIGSADGAKFRRFAQGVTLDRLTGLANRHLATLNPRYRLARADGLGLTIIDRDMGDELRSTRSLSGGERFLASLALALALSGLEGRRSFVDTLFIDEGFGALDGATLDVAIDALESLQSEGRKVGVISHVAAMHERIRVQIRVEKAGVGRSRVSVVGATS